MVTWTLAKKDLRVLLRDRRAVIILLVMPLVFILVLGLSLGEGFGQKPDDRLRISIVDLDKGSTDPSRLPPGTHGSQRWFDLVLRDLKQTAGVRPEVITREEADKLIDEGKQAAVLVFGPAFSERVGRCSFLADGINPFYRDGVKLDEVDVKLLEDPTQLTASSIIKQVAQVTLLRTILPWMIGRAFEKLSDPAFLNLLGKEIPGYALIPGPVKRSLGTGIQAALKKLFPKYDLIGKTWEALTKSEPRPEAKEEAARHKEGRYQRLVPSYTVIFAFFLVLTVGWMFVAERVQGTWIRLRAAPLSHAELLAGKLVPCLIVSLAQGFFLIGAGKFVFGMDWGPEPAWLILVIVSTSLAAMGLALLVASVAKTEAQVAIYGTLLVLVLAGLSGCMMGDRSLMPEAMQNLSLFTPQAWALDAYLQLLTNPIPDLARVIKACGVLAGFGGVFTGLAWFAIRLY